MIRVVLSSALQRLAAQAGREAPAQLEIPPTLEIEATSYRELLRALDARFPGFAEAIDDRMAIAVDGEIISDPLLEPIPAGSEVHFVPRIGGG